MQVRILGALCVCAWLTAGCQSAAWKSFDQVRVGQDKAAVVENIGSPTKTRRWQGKDRWIYEFGDHPGGTLVREVQFDEGRVIYVGPLIQPKVSAAEQDRLNESSNQQEGQRLDEIRDRRDQRLGISRARHDDAAGTGKPDPADQKLRESMYGVEPDHELERRKRAPVYVPVD